MQIPGKTHFLGLLFWNQNGTKASVAVQKEIQRQKGDSFSVRLLAIDTDSFNEDEIRKSVQTTSMIVPVLTANCLLQTNFVRAIEIAVQERTKIMLLHDQASCYFPGEAEQPKSLMMSGVFKDKAVTFMEDYVDNVVEQMLKKYQRYLDSKKTHDFLLLLSVPCESASTWKLTDSDIRYFDNLLPKTVRHYWPIYRTYLMESEIATPAPDDEQNTVFRSPTEEEKEKLVEFVRTAHAIFYIPQGRRGNKMASVSRTEMFIYEQALLYNTRIYIMDQHGVYAGLIAQFAKRYGVNSGPILDATKLFLPLYGTGISVIETEKKLGGCKSLATTTRAFISHKRSSGQGIAGRIYEGLKEDYSIFLDSEADFDLHDLEVIVERTENFILLLTEGILDSYWCIQEIRSAMRNKKKFIIVKEYRFNLPELEHMPAELQDVGKVIHESETLTYMAEFYVPFIANLKQLIGQPDVKRALCETQIGVSVNGRSNSQFMDILKSGKWQKPHDFSVSPDPSMKEITDQDLLEYFAHLGYNLQDFIVCSRSVPQTAAEAIWIGDHCPHLTKSIRLNGLVSDLELIKVFNGKRFQELESLSIGDSRDPVLLASNMGLTVALQNLPKLKQICIGKPERSNPDWYDWLIHGKSLTSVVVYDKGYVQQTGKNVPPNCEKVTIPDWIK